MAGMSRQGKTKNNLMLLVDVIIHKKKAGEDDNILAERG